MKSQGIFRAGSVALIASAAIMLSGCGVTSAASSRQAGQHVTQKGKAAIRTRTVATPSTHKGIPNTPPFAGSDVRRYVSNNAPSALPNGYYPKHYYPLIRSRYHIVQSWTGMLAGHQFIFTVYKRKGIIRPYGFVGASYNGRVVAGFSPGIGRVDVRNFTGDQVVCFYSGNPYWFSINLIDGRVNNGAANQSGYYWSIPKNAGYVPGPSYIMGLPKKYPVNP